MCVLYEKETCNMNMDLIRFMCILKAWPCKPPTQNQKTTPIRVLLRGQYTYR